MCIRDRRQHCLQPLQLLLLASLNFERGGRRSFALAQRLRDLLKQDKLLHGNASGNAAAQPLQLSVGQVRAFRPDCDQR